MPPCADDDLALAVRIEDPEEVDDVVGDSRVLSNLEEVVVGYGREGSLEVQHPTLLSSDLPGLKPLWLGSIQAASTGSIFSRMAFAQMRLSLFTMLIGLTSAGEYKGVPSGESPAAFLGMRTERDRLIPSSGSTWPRRTSAP